MLRLTGKVLQFLADEAHISGRKEACGLLLGEGERIYEARSAANVHPDPETHFEIDPQALIDMHRAARGGGPQVLGYYHSHPSGPAEPSATDREHAARDGCVWAIVAGEKIAFWRDGPAGFVPLSYMVAER
jgi:proteasome lid subunit RPN8/RPN11